MKSLLLMILISFAASVKANNYYFSSVSGDDSRSALQAQHPSAPWKTLTKLNSVFSTLKAGDSILFKRGETFYGSITVNKSGTPALPIVISAYGTGDKPIITGFQNLTSWANIGNGKYECENANLNSHVNMLVINDVEQEMGRYPNSNAANGGYLNFESHINNNSITDNQLTSGTVWKGAELVVRTNRYIIDRTTITAHSGTKISYKPALSYPPISGFGYFIQNDIRTLDQFGEWYYNPNTHKMTVYFGSKSPCDYTIKASAVESIVNIYKYENIVLDNLSIMGANSYSVLLYSTTNTNIKNCDINFSGIDAVSANDPIGIIVENSNVSNTNNIGINLNHSLNGTVRNNKVKNSGVFKGMGQSHANKSLGIRETGKHNLIEYNEVEATGYIAIRFGGDYTTVKNNFVNGFNLTKDDGGGIYTTDNGWARQITGNIIINGVGAAVGTSNSFSEATYGIYLDDDANKVLVTNNSIAKCNRSGIFLHNAHEITMSQNTLFNNGSEQLLMTHNMSSRNSPPLRNNILNGNVLFAKNADQGILNINTCKNDVSLAAGTMNNNYYCRPLDDNFIIKTASINEAGKYIYQDCDLQGWSAFYNKDSATKKTAVKITSYKLKALIGQNKFDNGDFNTSISGVNVGSTATSFSKSWVDDDIDGGTFQLVASSTKPGLTKADMLIGAVSTAKKYIIGFTVKNSSDTLMYVYARQTGAPYKILSNNGVKSIVRMTPSRKDYQLAFTPTVDETNASIFLETPSQTLKWSLDNVKVYEADVTETNSDDSVRFEYNATKTARKVSLDGTYTDPKGTVFKNSILIEPFSSAILIKQNTGPDTPPTVAITTPVTGTSFTPFTDITINASANDADGSVSKVEFYNGDKLLHTELTAPYRWVWKNVPAGNYVLTAKATDDGALVASSSAVTISVKPPKVAPALVITSPTVNQNYTSTSTIYMSAVASDTDGTIKTVKFFSNKVLLRTEWFVPYTHAWKNVPAGNYTITAVATDNDGLTTSRSVKVTVTENKAPAVHITGSKTNIAYNSSTTINLSAIAADKDGSIKKVAFYNGSTLIRTEWTYPYTYAWKKVPAGNYVISAVATDNNGLTGESNSLSISVGTDNRGVSAIGPVVPSLQITPFESQDGSTNKIYSTQDSSLGALSIKVVPNPASSVLLVFTSGIQMNKQLTMTLLSMSGAELAAPRLKTYGNTVRFNISSFPAGVYMVRVVSGNNAVYKQFVKQ